MIAARYDCGCDPAAEQALAFAYLFAPDAATAIAELLGVSTLARQLFQEISSEARLLCTFTLMARTNSDEPAQSSEDASDA